jgi:uncharacterized protein YggE
VLVALALVAGVAWSGYAPRAQAAQTPSGPERTITVVGRGEVKSAPDVAQINLGVEVIAPTVAEALDEADARMQAILDALKAAGIESKDIQTSNFSINFERQSPEPRPMSEEGAPAGVYRVSNMVRVTVRDLDKVGEIIDAAVTAGANNVWGVQFGLEDTAALEEQAREKAVADARTRAESLAALNGVEVGDVVTISEVVGGGAVPMFAAAERAFGGGGTPVESGEVTFATQIQIVYGIR